VYASRTRKEKFSGPGNNCQKNVTDVAGSLVTSSKPPGRPQKRPDDRTSNASVVVQTADSRPQMLPTSNVQSMDAAVHHVLSCFVLQTSMDCCNESHGKGNNNVAVNGNALDDNGSDVFKVIFPSHFFQFSIFMHVRQTLLVYNCHFQFIVK